MRSSLSLLAFVIVSSAAVAHAGDDGPVRYVGIHPVAADHGAAFCYIEFPHVHHYAPARAEVLYRKHHEGNYFIGDPVPYGYEGPKQSYYGPHPVHVDHVLGDGGDHTEYCYLDGPHYHPFAPAPEARFKLEAGVYFYTGELPRVYVEARPRYARINAVYKPFRYQRPVVVVAPPPEYAGPVYVEEPEPRTTVVVPSRASAGVRAEAGIGISAGFHFGIPAPVVVHEVHPAHTVVVHEHHDVHVVKHKHKHKHHGHKYKHHKHKHGKHGRGWGRH